MQAIAYKLLNKKTIWRGQEFRFLRKWIGLTAEELGRILGHVKRGTISRWENEKIPITSATHHQMLLLVLRLKEEAINERMDLEIAVTEILGMIVEQAKTPASITITPDTIKRLPFSVPKSLKASTRSSSFGSMRERWFIREIGRVGAGSSLDEDERVWYDLSKRDDGIRP